MDAGQQFSPPLSYACLSVPPPEDATRRFYTIFEPRLDHRQRPADEAWRLIDFITDAVRQVSERVRLVYLITRPLGGFAAPQLVLTLASAPPRHRSVPVDLREIGGLVHTIEVCFPSPILSIWASLGTLETEAYSLWTGGIRRSSAVHYQHYHHRGQP